MNPVRLIKSSVLAVAVGAALATVMGVPAASAEALAPWWGVGTNARPTSLQSGLAKNEVHEVTVTATSGDVFWLEPVALEKEEIKFAVFPFNASHEVVQSALEGLYGAGNVEVSGGPGGEKPYVVTFRGELGGVAVKPMPAGFAAFSCFFEPADPCLKNEKEPGEPEPERGKVAVSELTKGVADGQVVVSAQNRGDAPTSGPVTISDQLPAGLRAAEVKGVAGGPGAFKRGPVSCTVKPLTCTYERNEEGGPGSLPPFEQIELVISVVVEPGAKSGGLNTATVSGGGAAAARSASHPIKVGGAGSFGIDEYTLIPEQVGGGIDTQAGSHPFQVTSTVTLNSQSPDPVDGNPRTFALPKDIVADLPPGFIGNPTPFAQCTDAQFGQDLKEPSNLHPEQLEPINACPASSAIGAAALTFNEPFAVHFATIVAPIFNMVPRRGEPARFGFKAAGIVSAFLDTSIRSGGDYGVTVGSFNIPQIQWLLGVKLTFWGTPGASAHDRQRGWDCLQELGGTSACPSTNASDPPPFLIMPSSCKAPFQTTIRGESWGMSAKPAEVAAPVTYTLPEAVDGCNRLPFAPEVRVTPDGTAASSPTGLNVDVHVPQESILHSESLAQSAVKDISVALPEGVAVNPAGGDGLESCSEGLVGFTGFNGETANFTPALPDPLLEGVNFCPDASKIGTVKIKTPLLPAGQFLEGSVYLATQNQNPFGSLIALYLVAKDPVSGVVFKAVGETHLTDSGQIIGTFKNNPQLAFEDAELHFFGGERAPLATPAHCGSYTTSATFTPWSGNGPVTSQDHFDINAGPNGSPCPGPTLPFSPSLAAGTTNIQAGAFSNLTTTISREDGNQNLGTVQLHMPPGLSGLLSGVKLCGEAQANEGTCGPESLIGETTVSAGVGSDPVSVKGGRVYITEKYQGAPFGLSIVNPVKAGPFDLEHDTSNPNQQPPCDCVVVRAKVDVDPTSAALTVTTDPSGPHAIPHLIDGIPVQIKKVNVLVNRPGFTFNPTNCNPQNLTGTIASSEGASSPVSVPFQVTNCATLKFTPKFSVSTSGRTSKANGASLVTKVAEPPGAFGTQANITRVKVELPKQLPSRLTTLQKACTNAQFQSNPAGCPAASIIGHAKVITPLLPVPLQGPAIFVSHGGEAFPSLIMVLQGYGVTIDLVGTTFINKAGITSTTFKTVPDAPFNTFELTLPQGKFSALAANGSLCTSKLVMPSEFVGQNGALIKQKTPISVSGCAKKKALTRKQKLAKALKACKRKAKGKRAACQRQAHKRYGPSKKKGK
jgi:hypothetical protein